MHIGLHIVIVLKKFLVGVTASRRHGRYHITKRHVLHCLALDHLALLHRIKHRPARKPVPEIYAYTYIILILQIMIYRAGRRQWRPTGGVCTRMNPASAAARGNCDGGMAIGPLVRAHLYSRI